MAISIVALSVPSVLKRDGVGGGASRVSRVAYSSPEAGSEKTVNFP
jgi:hypothetical protein